MASPNSTSFDRPDIGLAFIEIDAAAIEAGFVGLEIAPPFMASLQTGNFEKVKIATMLEEAETARSSKGGYTQGDWEFEQDSYTTSEYGAVERIDDRQAAIYAYALDYDLICAARARYKVLSQLERDIKTAAEAAGGATAVSVPWSTSATADPVQDVLNEIDTFKLACGHMPNAGWLTDKCLRKLALCASIKDQVKFSGIDDPKLLTEPAKRSAFLQALAALFGLPQLVVAGAMRNTAAKNQAFAGANIWTDSVFGLIRKPMTNDLQEVCAMRTIFSNVDGAGSPEGAFDTYREEGVKSDMMRFRMERKVKTMQSLCVRRLTGVVA